VNVPQREFDSAVVFLPKSKDLTDYILNAVASRLEGREVFLVGEKKAVSRGGQATEPVRQAAQARQRAPLPTLASHRGQCTGSQTAGKPGPGIRLPLAEGPLKVISLPGVFSHGRLDRGSALLLEHLDKLPSGHLLDFGCGAGVLGAAVKRRYPHNQVTLLDVDASPPPAVA
jgi:16S rRNA (guanine1207-N2)-methyltransferase